MSLKQLSEEEFQTFIEKQNGYSFEQTNEMANLRRQRGYLVERIGLKDKNDTILVAAILFKQKVFGGLKAGIHYGPVYLSNESLEDFLLKLKDYARKSGIIELEIKPYDTYQRFDDKGEPTSTTNDQIIQLFEQAGYQFNGLTKGFETCDWHYVKDLKGLEPESLLKSFNKNSIRNIKNAQQLGIKIRSIAYHEIEEFKKVIEETGERQGFTAKDLSYYQNLYQMFGDNCSFLIAELNPKMALIEQESYLTQLSGQTKNEQQQIQKIKKLIEQLTPLAKEHDKTIILAALILLLNKGEATYLYGGSYTKYQKFSAPFLLQYHAMMLTLKKQIPTYNFLGITGEFDGSDGVLRFKQNFNGYIKRKPGFFDYHPNPIKYKLIQLLKKCLRR